MAVRSDRLRLIVEHTQVGALVATAFAFVLALHLRPSLNPMLVDIWLALKVAVVFPRIIQAQQYRRSAPQFSEARERWLTWLLFLDGFVWGVGGAAFSAVPPVEAAVLAASIACVSCVAAFGLQVRQAATMAYTGPMLLLTAAGLAWRGDELGLIGGTGLVMLLTLILITAKRSELRLAEVFRLRALAEALASERAQALIDAKGQLTAKTEFVARMSHELRTPLQGVMGMADLIGQEVNDATQKHRAEMISNSGRQLLTLISDLLDASRLEAGVLALRPESFDIGQALEEMADVYAIRAREHQQYLHTRFNFAAPFWVNADWPRLRQVLDNLLGNAVKFTPRGGTISFFAAQVGDSEFLITVQDNGPGIPADELPRLFKPFAQVSTGSQQAGAGLGLSIARDLVTAMGGDLTCESTVGHGTAFKVRLPFKRVYQAPAPAFAQHAVPDLPIAPALAWGRTVLLAEDDHVNALVATAALEKHGWRVHVVANGAEAVNALCRYEGRPAVVLMDCYMPELDGLDATKSIRAWEHKHNMRPVPVVGLTGAVSAGERHLCFEAGMDDVLTKPYSMRVLADTVARFANARHEERPVAVHAPTAPRTGFGPLGSSC